MRGLKAFITMSIVLAVLIVAVEPGLQQETHAPGLSGRALESFSLENSTNASASESTHSIGFLKETLVLSNNTLIPGDFLQGNNSQEPVHIAYDPVNGNLYVSMEKSGQVAVVNGSSNMVQDSINVGVKPFGVAFDPVNSYIYVTDIGSRNVSVIDPQNNSVVKTLVVGNNPFAMAFDPLDGNMYVTDSNTTGLYTNNPGTVSVINSTSNEVISNFTVGSDPQGIAFDSANGEMFIAMAGGGYVQAITNLQTGVSRLFGGGLTYHINGHAYFMQMPTTLCYSPKNKMMYIGDLFTGNVFGVNSTNQVVSSTQEGVPNSIFFDSANGYTYVVNGIRGVYGEVSAIDPATNARAGNLWIGRYPNGFAMGSAFDGRNGYFYVTNPVVGTLAIFQSMGPSAVVFKSVGLAAGSSWTVSFGGVEVQSTSASIQFNQQNGTYSYSISSYGGYYPMSATHGNISLEGGPVTVTVHFISYYYLLSAAVGIPTAIVLLAIIIMKRRENGKR